jgi:hypothetical protein
VLESSKLSKEILILYTYIQSYMGSIGKKIGGSAGKFLGSNERVPIDEETAEVVGEVTGELAEAGIEILADRL